MTLSFDLISGDEKGDLPSEGVDWYISGPMTGIEDFNYPAFEEAARFLREQGFSVDSPHEHFGGDQSLELTEYLRHDISESILKLRRGLIMLPGWETSVGAYVEVTVALAIGLEVRYWDPNDDAPGPKVYYGDPRTCLLLHFSLAGTVGGQGPGAHSSPAEPSSVSYDGKQLEEEEGRSILLQAEGIINGDRAKAYGHPLDNFARIAAGWSMIAGTVITPEMHILMMEWLKIARLMETPDHHDSLVDGVGYWGTYEKVIKERKRRQESGQYVLPQEIGLLTRFVEAAATGAPE